MKCTICVLCVVVSCVFAEHARGQECPGDLDHNGSVTIDEIIAVVNSALNGCGDAAQQEIMPGPDTSTPTPDAMTGPLPTPAPGDLNALLGTWVFNTEVNGTVVTDPIVLDAITNATGYHIVTGRDSNDGGLVTAGKSSTLAPAFATRLRFGMLHLSATQCDLWLFNFTSATTVEGADYPMPVSNGTCGNMDAGAFPMTGVQIAPFNGASE